MLICDGERGLDSAEDFSINTSLGRNPSVYFLRARISSIKDSLARPCRDIKSLEKGGMSILTYEVAHALNHVAGRSGTRTCGHRIGDVTPHPRPFSMKTTWHEVFFIRAVARSALEEFAVSDNPTGSGREISDD